jgi:hypothetical protein
MATKKSHLVFSRKRQILLYSRLESLVFDNFLQSNETPRRKRTGYHDGLFALLFAPRGGELNPKRLKKVSFLADTD